MKKDEKVFSALKNYKNAQAVRDKYLDLERQEMDKIEQVLRLKLMKEEAVIKAKQQA